MIDILVNGKPIYTVAEASRIIFNAAAKKGYDPEEALAVLQRAFQPNDDGEDARDMLFFYHDGFEVFVE